MVSDVFGRPIEVTTPNGVRQVSEYDDVANTVRTGLIEGFGGLAEAPLVSQTVRDDTDRVVEETGVRGDKVEVPRSTTKYDGLGRVTEQVGVDLLTTMLLNPDGSPKTTTMTPAKPDTFTGQPITAERDYNVLGVSTKKTLSQPDGQAREGVSRVLDAAGRTISETDQGGTTTTYEYTIDGLVAQVNNQTTGVVTRNTYDPVTRALTVSQTAASDGTVSAKGFEYDPVSGEIKAVFDSMRNDETRIAYAYDVFGNVTQISYPDGKTVRHTFDEHGRQTTSTDIDGNVTTYEYDWLGLLTGATQTSPQGATLARVGYAYDVFGRMVKLSRGNNVTTEYTFTSADEIKTETTTHHGTVISDASYEYDTHGNLTNRVDTRTGSDTSAGLVTETTVYTYNAYNQLTSSSVYPGEISTNGIVPRLTPSLLTQYQIGVSGDVIKETVTQGQTVTVREFEANTLGQTIAITTNGVRAEQSYDLAGNLTQAANGTTYTYDVFNQAMTETHPGRTTTEHTYWVTGQRHTTSEESLDMSNSETATMYWDGNAVINDTHTRGITQVTGSYLIGAFRHTRTLSGVNADTNSPSETDLTSTNYYVTDRHGNTTATADTEGVVTAVYTYTDYGVPTEHIPLGNSRTEADRNPFQYAGEYTTQTGFQYLGTRIYDPKTFTFTTKDVAEQFNLYAYANSNPITLVDPTGQTAVSDMGDILMPVLGAILAFLGLAWAIPTGGATVNLISAGISIAVGLVDVGIAVAQVVDVFDDNFMDDHTAQILGFTSVALGFGAIAGAKLASRTAAAAAQRAAQQAETAASIATYRAAPTVEWDTAVAHVATRKSRIIVPQVPAHHHLRKALVQHPEYSKTSFVSWAFIGKANWWGPRELLDNIAGLADSHVFKIRRRIVESVYRPWYESFPLDTVSKNSVRQEINALPLVSPKSYKKAINDSVTSSYSSSSSSDNFGTDSENAIELNLLSSTY